MLVSMNEIYDVNACFLRTLEEAEQVFSFLLLNAVVSSFDDFAADCVEQLTYRIEVFAGRNFHRELAIGKFLLEVLSEDGGHGSVLGQITFAPDDDDEHL